jgi:putative transposase
VVFATISFAFHKEMSHDGPRRNLKVEIKRAYKYELDLNNEQRTACLKHAGAASLDEENLLTVRTGHFAEVIVLTDDLEVFDPVIVFDAVDVMDVFMLFEVAVKVLLHDKPMLWNVWRPFPVECRWVAWAEDVDVVAFAGPSFSSHSAALPAGAFLAAATTHLGPGAFGVLSTDKTASKAVGEGGVDAVADIILVLFRQRLSDPVRRLAKFLQSSPDDARRASKLQANIHGIKPAAIQGKEFFSINFDSLHRSGPPLPHCNTDLDSVNADAKFVSIQVETSIVVPDNQGPAVGVDLGVKTLATLSDGRVFENPKAYRRKLQVLKRAQRVVARRQKGSKRRERAKWRVANLHFNIANIRSDAIHKMTTLIAVTYGMVGIEDLNVSGMTKNHCLAGAVSDAAFGEVRRQLEYKCQWYGSALVVHGRFLPSSKTCSVCGEVKDSLPLSERTFRCDCGHESDRDLNAAMNLCPAVRRVLDVDGKALVVAQATTKPARLKRQPNTAKNR